MTSAVPELADLVRLVVNEVLHGAQRVLTLLVPERTLGTEPVFVNLLRSPGIDPNMRAGTTTLFVVLRR
jgi:hypothetical protein